MKALVCGGAHYDDYAHVWNTLDEIDRSAIGPITCVIHGDAPGVDTFAKIWAQARDKRQAPYPARWHDRATGKCNSFAGPERNHRMLHDGNPDYLIAFLGSTGTEDMLKRAAAKLTSDRIIKVQPRGH